MENKDSSDLLPLVLHLGDTALIHGQRLAEWCGHAPILEQDIAITNIALDLIGQGRSWYSLAAEIEGHGRHEDDYAYFRTEMAFRNFLLSELPNGDWAQTTLKMFFIDCWHLPLLQHISAVESPLMGVASKAVKEVMYHIKWSSEWVVRLGDGTEESLMRMQKALDYLWPYCGEWESAIETFSPFIQRGIYPSTAQILPLWKSEVVHTLHKAGLSLPAEAPYQKGSLKGIHTEYLGYILAEMQSLTRAYPDAKW
jgi:ring-1,2-phenylacetyl-CoA epoxidase subunit PaaC